jgi:hypothetical protein
VAARVKASKPKIVAPTTKKRSAPKRRPPKGVMPPALVAHQWRPGQSANPGGRPQKANEVAILARSYTLDAIQTLATLMLDPEVKPRDRAYCADIILDRGVGKAPLTVKLDVDDEAALALTRGERQAAVQDIDRVKQIVQILAAAGALDQVIDQARKPTHEALREDAVEVEYQAVVDGPITSTRVTG